MKWKVIHRAWGRLSIATAVGATAALVGLAAKLHPVIDLLMGWDAASSALLILTWGIILRSGATATRLRAAGEDPGRTAVWLLVLLGSTLSLVAGTFLSRRLGAVGAGKDSAALAACVLAVALAWTLVHTSYALRYAHLYYRGNGEGGLTFPGDEEPNDLDFAYFAFTIGMCFQVSDVSISLASIRRVVLGQAVLAFFFNTVIIAFVLSLVFGKSL